MRKLLRANFSRMLHDRVFWLLMALMAFFGASTAVANAVSIEREGGVWVLDFTLITYITLAPVLNSVFTALFVGCDYSSGTLRSKLIAGHRRVSIYLANLITCCFAGLAMCLAFIIPHCLLGLPLGGQLQSSPAQLLVYGGLGLALMLAFTALFTLIAMLCRNRAYTVAGCILLAFVLLFIGVLISSALNEPEYLSGYTFSENGMTVEEPGTRNPNYVGGVKRQIYEFLQDFTPGGQVIKISSMDVENPAVPALYDLIILLASTGFGIIFFRRKDLK